MTVHVIHRQYCFLQATVLTYWSIGREQLETPLARNLKAPIADPARRAAMWTRSLVSLGFWIVVHSVHIADGFQTSRIRAA